MARDSKWQDEYWLLLMQTVYGERREGEIPVCR